jgi:hypothetical protein
MKKYELQYLINCLKSLNKSHISQKDVDANSNIPSSSTFKRYFGNWKNAIEHAELKTGIITGRPQDEKIIINEKALEIITGELLGDGCLTFSGQYKTNAHFEHSTANISYGKYLYNKLQELNIPLLKPEYLKPRVENSKIQFRTRTTTNIAWTELYNIWYKNNTKISPNIKLTKEICLHWFLGDGYFEQGTIKISTCGFTYNEIKELTEKLSAIGFKSSPNKRSGGYYVIRFSKNSYLDFLNWIGPCPVNNYEHRWGKNEKNNI